MYRLKDKFLNSKKWNKKYSPLLLEHTADGTIDVKTLIKTEKLNEKEATRIFEMTGAEYRAIKNPPKNTLAWDVTNGWGLEHLEKPIGQRCWFENRQVHLCARLADGSIVGIFRPTSIDTPPEKLYRAINWDAETRVLFELSGGLMEKLRTGAIVVIMVILLFFAFIVVT